MRSGRTRSRSSPACGIGLRRRHRAATFAARRGEAVAGGRISTWRGGHACGHGDRRCGAATRLALPPTWRRPHRHRARWSPSRCRRRSGGSTFVVNNAGISAIVNGPMLGGGRGDVRPRVRGEREVDLSRSAGVRCPVFRRQGGGGVILTTASTAGLRPRPGLVWYNGSKGAAITLTKSDGGGTRARKDPGELPVPGGGRDAAAGHVHGRGHAREARAVQGVDPARAACPRRTDIANAALYLCSDEAEFITGVAFEVDGGRCI
jgi:3-oxoacyl-[acyl-carrier protein] reductase